MARRTHTHTHSLYDKCHAVRVHAALSIKRVQDPEDENCPVVKGWWLGGRGGFFIWE